MKLFKKQDKEAKAKTKSKKPDKGGDDGGSDGKKKRGGGGDGIQTLIANHIEKMLFVIAVLAALFLAFKGFSARTAIRDNMAPDELQQQAQQASTKVNSFSWNEFKAERDREKNFLERSNETQQKVAADKYSIGQLIKPPYVPAKTLRTDPVLLAARDLRVVSGYGPMIVKSRPGDVAIQPREPNAPQRINRDLPWQQWVRVSGDQTRGIYFNAITALIPYAEQVAEYAVLKNTEGYDRERDQPKYLQWALFREELVPGQPVKKKTITRATLQKLEATWGGEGERTLDPSEKFQHEILTCKVPPILVNDLPRFTTHPGIPLTMPDSDEQASVLTGVSDDSSADESDPFSFSFREGRRGPETPSEGGPENAVEDAEAPPDYYLFRYFDTEVAPGRTYRYRLILLMDDPNRPLDGTPPPADTLDQSVAERLRTSRGVGLRTPTSDPSGAVYVAHGGRVFAGEVTAAERVTVSQGVDFPRDEPSATIMATTFLPDTGARIPVVEQVYRGTVANYKKSVWYWPPKGNRAYRAEDQVFRTDSTIVDIRGGTELADTGLKAPGQLLVFDRQGQMTVIDELNDATVFESSRVPDPEPEARPETSTGVRNGEQGRDLLEGGPRRRDRRSRGTRERGQRNR